MKLSKLLYRLNRIADKSLTVRGYKYETGTAHEIDVTETAEAIDISLGDEIVDNRAHCAGCGRLMFEAVDTCSQCDELTRRLGQ